MNYIDPSFIHPDRPTTGTTTKRIQDMSTAELKERANKDAVVYFRQQYEQNPTDPMAKAEYESACFRANQKSDAEVNRLYSIPLDKLKTEFESKGHAVEEQNLESYREKQAEIWLASQPRYVPTPEAATLMVERINALGLRGTVHELQFVFEQLVEEGKITAPAIPVPLYSREELQTMSAADMKAALQEMGY